MSLLSSSNCGERFVLLLHGLLLLQLKGSLFWLCHALAMKVVVPRRHGPTKHHNMLGIITARMMTTTTTTTHPSWTSKQTTHIIRHTFWAGRGCISDGYLPSSSLYSASDAEDNKFKPCGEDEGTASEGLYRRFADVAWTKLLATGWLEEEEVVEATTRTAPTTTISTEGGSSVLEDASSPVRSSRHRPFQRLQYKQAPAKGMPPGSTVEIEIRALRPKSNLEQQIPVQYARLALLETLVPVTNTTTATIHNQDDPNEARTILQSRGIQVLNLVVFPSHFAAAAVADSSTTTTTVAPAWPVWGADFVSLPGGKHLFLLDAQPMQGNCTWFNCWNDWYQRHIKMMDDEDSQNDDNKNNYNRNQKNVFSVWGGRLPPAVRQFVSPHALWSRLVEGEKEPSESQEDTENPHQELRRQLDNDAVRDQVHDTLLPMFEEHMDIYLNKVLSSSTAPGILGRLIQDTNVLDDDAGGTDESTTSWFGDYLSYRLQNDPARPMLKSLYGEEWTEQVLQDVLFPDWLRHCRPPNFKKNT